LKVPDQTGKECVADAGSRGMATYNAMQLPAPTNLPVENAQLASP
jgi:hypothetical protein